VKLRAHLVLCAASLVTSCGSAGPAPTRTPEVDPPHFILEVGSARVAALSRPEGDADALRTAVRQAPAGDERRQAMQNAAIGLMYAADSATDARAQRRLRRDSTNFAGRAKSGSRDDFQVALMEFVEVWNAWRAAARNAGRLAERYTTQRREAGELYTLMWAIRGEIALELHEWQAGADAFRYYLGQLDHPLYAYGLWRTARCYRGLERDADAVQALTEARDLGCAHDVDPAVLKVAAVAGREVGTSAVEWPDGSVRPGTCRVPGEEPAESARGEDD
jgi:hypothetical protein